MGRDSRDDAIASLPGARPVAPPGDPKRRRAIRTPALPLARWLSLVPYRLRLLRVFAYLTWPDGGIGWFPFALAAALRAARRERPDVILATSPPQSGHLAALLVHRVTRIPWVADFRDEWAADAFRAGQPRPLAGLSRRLERAITTSARHVVVAADYFRLEGLPAADGRRVVVVNGVDEADMPRAIGPPRERFVLAYVGTLYGIRDPTPVRRALHHLVERGEIDSDRLEVRLVGSLWLPEFEPPPGLRVEKIGYLEHGRALGEMWRRRRSCSTSPARASHLPESCSSTSPRGGRCCASRTQTTWPAGSCATGTRVSSPIQKTKRRSSGRWSSSGGAGRSTGCPIRPKSAVGRSSTIPAAPARSGSRRCSKSC